MTSWIHAPCISWPIKNVKVLKKEVLGQIWDEGSESIQFLEKKILNCNDQRNVVTVVKCQQCF